MVIRNIPKSLAESYPSLLSEFRPKWKAEVVEEDYNLYKLINVDGIGNRVDCDCPERMCKITPILDWPLPGREYPLVLADDIVGI